MRWNDDGEPAWARQTPCMSDFRKLQVWQKAHVLSIDSSRFALLFARKRSGLANQITRAADAIPSHIAEGRGSATDADFARYVTMAIKEANELECHLQRAVDSGFCPPHEHARLTAATVEVRKMLTGLRKRLLS